VGFVRLHIDSSHQDLRPVFSTLLGGGGGAKMHRRRARMLSVVVGFRRIGTRRSRGIRRTRGIRRIGIGIRRVGIEIVVMTMVEHGKEPEVDRSTRLTRTFFRRDSY
jgi:hypothetical protein